MRYQYKKLRSSTGDTFLSFAFKDVGDKTFIGMSMCNPNDQFDKKKGRSIAESRCGKNHPFSFVSDEATERLSDKEILRGLALLYGNGFLPDWAVSLFPIWIIFGTTKCNYASK